MASPEAAPLARPVSLACLECRQAHLKCDGNAPVCARCVSRGLSCIYAVSRRGCRRSTKRRTAGAESVGSPTSLNGLSASSLWVAPDASGLDELAAAASVFDDQTLNNQPALPVPVLLNGSNAQESERLQPWFDDELLVNMYYLNFHNSHPLLLPKSLYCERGYPRALKAVVEFVGSHFSPAASSDALRLATERELESGEQNTPEIVQARVLYAILLFARSDISEGQRMLAQAINIAMDLGMHRRDFAASYANNRPMEEESMRRTWYELYITDGCVAAFQRKSSFTTNTVSADVLLPCDDSVYDDGVCLHKPASRGDFESSAFADEERVFSSFSYRVEAVRILGRVLAITGAHGVHRDQVQAVDNALAGFLHHLPPSKSEAEVVDMYGELDELMFQAHSIIQYATILLHFPRGDLASPGPLAVDMPGGNSAKFVCPCTRQHVHSIKAIEASKALSMLAAFRAPVQRHSPFFVYPLALGAVVQLSASTIHSASSTRCFEQHFDRIKLISGVLKSLSRFWPIADMILRSLNRVALAVFQALRSDEPAGLTLQHDVMDCGLDPCSNAMTGSTWLEGFDVQDLQGLIGFDTNGVCF
ncbi:hypothetical protein BDV95DRAFT_602974 [Massariosphaeria phaeospora]|uniref:Zn(2)-C6 fungal-type domain-containing protein n=1 Tax=Massariosphaeria phaeospora TaxID=100035 RepID=A0A7C8IBK5_9PLEO|nr:hypothetical protein BDV95DRAFT_602974 [Massariosphaeria phaeospora]